MKSLFLLCLTLGMVSCGLESIATLPAPEVNYLDGTLVTDTSLSFLHDASRYAGTDFQGYQAYYRIYPKSGDFSQLVKDRDSLATSPTVSRLVSGLGYSAMTISPWTDGRSSGLEEMVIAPTGDQTVTLSFSDFLSNPGSTEVPPVLQLDGIPVGNPYLYRSTAFSTSESRKFGALRSAVSKAVDMDSLVSGNRYEVNVFIVAYGFTATLETVYSTPMPWGVIRTIEP